MERNSNWEYLADAVFALHRYCDAQSDCQECPFHNLILPNDCVVDHIEKVMDEEE